MVHARAHPLSSLAVLRSLLALPADGLLCARLACLLAGWRREEIVKPLPSNSFEELEANVEKIVGWVRQLPGSS